MRDFNFFAPYIQVKKASRAKYIYIILIIILLVASIGTYYTWYDKTVKGYEKEINMVQSYINASNTQQKVLEYDEMKRKVEIMNRYYGIVEVIHQQIDSRDNLNSAVLEQISAALPQGLFFKNAVFTADSVQIQGTSSNRTAVAELEHNLKKIDMLGDVHVSSISLESKESGSYTFMIKCVLKDVDMP